MICFMGYIAHIPQMRIYQLSMLMNLEERKWETLDRGAPDRNSALVTPGRAIVLVSRRTIFRCVCVTTTSASKGQQTSVRCFALSTISCPSENVWTSPPTYSGMSSTIMDGIVSDIIGASSIVIVRENNWRSMSGCV